MTNTLRSLQLLPRGPAGWCSPELFFGEATTLVSGPLGSGKSPMLKALAFSFGAAVDLPPTVKSQCSAVRLTFAGRDGVYELTRQIESGVRASAKGPAGEVHEIRDDRELTRWLLPQLGISEREFVTLNGSPTMSYTSLLAPAFLVDQDIGWSAPYVPPDGFRFVRNQREEVLRWVLDAPQRNRAVDKSAFQAAKAEHAATVEQIAIKRRLLEKLLLEIGPRPAPNALAVLEARRQLLHEQLRGASAFIESATQGDSALDAHLRDTRARRDALRSELAGLSRRRAQIADVQEDVVAETQALEQNEVAASAFRVLCGNVDCKFFKQPDESYGRRLLYLKDQLKDFGASASTMAQEEGRAGLDLAAAEARLAELTLVKRKATNSPFAVETIAAIEFLTRELSDVSVSLDRLERVAIERRQLDALINSELRASERVSELKPTGGRRDNSRVLDARAHLARSFNEWVAALRTPNVPIDAVVDEELRVIVGGERFDTKISHSGSTRTRLVLAFHAALLETSIAMGGQHPAVLVLDAPRQHELAPDDILVFVERFQSVVSLSMPRTQLILSATDEGVVRSGPGVAVWKPSFHIDGAFRYLGPG